LFLRIIHEECLVGVNERIDKQSMTAAALSRRQVHMSALTKLLKSRTNQPFTQPFLCRVSYAAGDDLAASILCGHRLLVREASSGRKEQQVTEFSGRLFSQICRAFILAHLIGTNHP
jgi:hypothetical protein